MDHCSNLSNKILVMVGYYLEVGYSLMINDYNNVAICTEFEGR